MKNIIDEFSNYLNNYNTDKENDDIPDIFKKNNLIIIIKILILMIIH